MSVRRFLAYFFAVTAGSTVVFASFLNAPGPSSADAANEAPPSPVMAQMFRELREHSRHGAYVKSPQVALAVYRPEN